MTEVVWTVWRRLWYTRLRDAVRGRFDASLDWREMIARARLPRELAAAIEQVVRRTRLWRGEKIDVATELIAHFQDGLEAGRSPDELLQSFGDQESAAKLIRRAKKRGRPLAWRVWHYGWMSVVALATMYIAAGLWMATGRPTIRVDYLAAVNKAPLAVPESERAWPIYRDGLLAMGFDGKEKESPVSVFLENTAKPGDPKWGDKEKFLNEHAEPIARLREAAGRANLGFVTSASHVDFSEKDRQLFGVTLSPEQIEAARHETFQDRWVMSTLLPDIGSLNQASAVLGADALRAANSGDGDTAYADVVAMLGIARHCEEVPFLVCVLVADALQGHVRGIVRDVLSQHATLWTDGQLRDLAHTLAASRIDWIRGFEGERVCFYDAIQRLYTDNGNGDGRLAFIVGQHQNVFQVIESATSGGAPSQSLFADSGLALLTLPAANMVVASRQEMSDTYDRLTNLVRAQIEIPYWKQDANASLDDELRILGAYDALGSFRYLFIKLLLPSYENLRNRIVMSDGARDGVLLGLALELYHRQHKKWPESLDELSPQWLPRLPVDRLTGKPLHYKIVDDRPLVYSTGVDGDDDGGRLPERCEGEPTNYLSANSQLKDPQKPAESQPKINGDWLIWTTLTNLGQVPD